MALDQVDRTVHEGTGWVTFAVLGRPDSRRFIRAPSSHQAMLELQHLLAISGEPLYCSTLAGGCGQPLHVVNGTERHPHFRHSAGSDCVLRDYTQARDRYTHRIVQEALVTWLARQGIEAQVEKTLDPHSRVDVYTEPSGAVIEVQLSSESASSMLERETRYGGTVTWLFGTKRSIASRSHVLDRDGLTLVVRLKPTTVPQPQGSMFFRDPEPVEIGIQHTAFAGGLNAVVWHPLSSCEFDRLAGRVRPPGYDRIVELVAEARARSHRVAGSARHPNLASVPHGVAGLGGLGMPARVRHLESQSDVAARSSDRASSEASLRAARQLAEDLRRSAPDFLMDGPRPSILSLEELDTWVARHGLAVPPESSPWRHTLRYHAGDYEERSKQIGAAWALGLPEHLVDPAWGALYQTIVVHSAPLSTLTDTQTDPHGLIIDQLISLGLIAVHSCTSMDAYQTAHDLRCVGTPLQWSQPPAWRSTFSGMISRASA